MPITVDNDVNLAALGEFWSGVGQNTQNMVLVANGTGIGAGIIIDGALYRGSHEASGEVGYMIPGRDFLGKSYLDFGAFETLASGTAIAKRIPALLESEPGLAHLDHLTVEDIFVAARLGQKWPWSILDEVVDYMAIIVANLSVSFDPELIVLGGGITRFAEPLVEPILQRIREMVPLPPKLVVSDLGLRATVMGAITTVLHNTSDFYVVRKLT
jgi:glucokinase